jgi:hypothetical protein
MAVFTDEQGQKYDYLDICRECYGSTASSDLILRELFGHAAVFGETFEVTSEVAAAVMASESETKQ